MAAPSVTAEAVEALRPMEVSLRPTGGKSHPPLRPMEVEELPLREEAMATRNPTPLEQVEAAAPVQRTKPRTTTTVPHRGSGSGQRWRISGFGRRRESGWAVGAEEEEGAAAAGATTAAG